MAKFLDTLHDRPLVFDGAIGTQLYERGIFINKCFDAANISNQELVAKVHQSYLAAGCDALTTNTFSANIIRLRKHGLEGQIKEINQQGVEIAKSVAGAHAFVGASVGPTGKKPAMLSDRELEEIRQAYREQIRYLADAGADYILLETFRQISEIRLAIEAAKEVSNLPVIAQLAFDSEARTADGADPRRAAILLREWGADVLGTNCLEGPNVVFNVVEAMMDSGMPIIAQPNAGYPRKIDNRLIYMATPEYFGVFARRYFKLGVRIVGGCCGTGPEHIKSIVGAARMMGASTLDHPISVISMRDLSEASTVVEVPIQERTKLAKKITRVYQSRVLGKGDEASKKICAENFVISVEVNPPVGLDLTKRIKSAKGLKKTGVDVINIADGPRASARMSNWALATEFKNQLHTETILHVCGRDRNLLALQMDLLAYHVAGLHNLVVITGDPPKVGDYPNATAVFDLDSIGILRLVQNFNRGVDPAGRDFGSPTRFFCACGAEPAAIDYDRELRRLELKKASGASYIMTQPIYDNRVLERFLDDTAHLDMPVMVGILPLASSRNAEFLHNEVPGMSVPESVRTQMEKAGNGPEARAVGIKIAQETLLSVQDRVVGAYLMPPFGRYSAVSEILSCIEGYTSPKKKK